MKKVILLSVFTFITFISKAQMSFEVKSYEKIGSYSIKGVEAIQYYQVVFGVVGCPYPITGTQRVEVKIPDTKNFKEVNAYVVQYLDSWLHSTYPNIPK